MNCTMLVLYWSKGGNTRKVAETIQATLEGHGATPDVAAITPALTIDPFAYNLVFVGAPVYINLGPQPVMKYLLRLRNRAANEPAAPEKPGRYAVVFCTYGGGHTGGDEAVPFLKYMGQVFAHEGFRVVDEWPVVGEFPGAGDPAYNVTGRIGRVIGRPDDTDLQRVAGRVSGLLRRLQHKLGIADRMQSRPGK